MCFLNKACDVATVVLILFCFKACTDNDFQNLDKKYHLVSKAYKEAKNVFDEGRENYNKLKNRSLLAIDTFLDLVSIMNDEMARELRTSIVKFYKIKYFQDFTNYAISMEEIMDITEHCLLEPVEKLDLIREQFHSVIKNFEDVRNFDVVDKCANELPDEVAAAHCVLHQAVLFNETMQDSLVTIVEIKTRQHAQDMNSSMYGVHKCLTDFVPKFFDQLLVDAYTPNCGYLKVVNASICELLKDKWRKNHTEFPKKWVPIVKLLKEKVLHPVREEPLFLTLFSANAISKDLVTTIH
ncbi:hypothetical protein O0L34_g17750 [Tuta absoluta]|nr:hypothetical protein O0L34_g17750 [Tuta absoluta]